MDHKPNRIVIVEEGVFEPEAYASWLATIKEVLGSATLPPEKSGEKGAPAAIIESVISWPDAKKKVEKNEVDTVIFISVGMIRIARSFREKFRNLTVYVFSGVEVEGEPYVIPKNVLNVDALQEIAKGY